MPVKRAHGFLFVLATTVGLAACGGGSGGGSGGFTGTVAVGDAPATEESGGFLRFPVTLSAAPAGPIAVDYTARGGTASSGRDFEAATGTVTIGPGASSGTIDVALLNDGLDEPDETVVVEITRVSGGSISSRSASGTILDDDPPPALSVAGGSVTEGDAGHVTLSFPVSLSAASGFEVTVDYATSDGSATEGLDYEAAAGSVSIPAGSTSASITVNVIGDTDEEGTETLTVTISNPANATLSAATATGSILDDDSGPVSGLPSRPSNAACVAPERPTLNAAVAVEAAFPSLPALTKPVGLLQAPGMAGHWFAVEKDGRVLRFDDSASAAAFETFIDIRSPGDPIDVESGPNEAGLLGVAFHPDYGQGNWYVYLSYNISDPGLTSVIARLESRDNGQTLDATSAVELIRLAQPYGNHNGGQITFGPDGYLYIHFGDGGSGGDPGDRAQDTTNLFGAILRIDVDGAAPYEIPPDNPFADQATLCNTGSSAQACPEIYAWGLRNAWRWSFDEATGRLWLGDVGQNAWEEIDLIERGGNYGWRCREGAHDFNTSGTCPAGLIDPVIEYDHGVGNSVTGGYVYRGSAIPELAGRYVFGDFSQGKLFASVDDGKGGYGFETLLDTSFLISSFAKEASGEILLLNYGGGDIHRVIQAGGSEVNPIPDKLSETGCVLASDPAVPAAGLIPYDVNAPFWSDGAAKERWYAIPDGTAIGVGSDGDWQFPVGTVLVKSFRLNERLIETRLFMRHTDGEWGGYTYEWNDSQTEATRVVGGKVKDIEGQAWIYPSESDCLQCHTATAGFSLGIEHAQLNRDFLYPGTGITANQLVTADAVDLLAQPLANPPENLPRLADPFDPSAGLETRARAYLHSNCAGCHRPGGPTPSGMDLRYDTALADTGTCNVVPLSGTLDIPGARLIAPGDAAASIVVSRTARRDSHGMPPLGSSLVDLRGVELLTEWIESLSGCP